MKDSFPKTSMPDKVAVALRESLEGGELAGEMYLPSSRELASKYGTSLLTVQKALRQLKEEKVIRLHSKRRGFVRVRDIARNGHTAVKRIAVLDRTKEPGANGEPMYLDIKELYYDKDRLLSNGDRWEREIAKNISLDSPYR